MRDNQNKSLKEPTEKPTEQPLILFYVIDEFYDDIWDTRDSIIDLLDALARQTLRLNRSLLDNEIKAETRIARTLVRLLSEKALELGDAARDIFESLDEMVH